MTVYFSILCLHTILTKTVKADRQLKATCYWVQNVARRTEKTEFFSLLPNVNRPLKRWKADKKSNSWYICINLHINVHEQRMH